MLLASSFPQNGISSSENFFLSTPFFLFFFSFKSYEIIFISVARFLLSSKWNILFEEFSFQNYIYIYIYSSFSPSFINFLPIQGGRKLLFLKFLRQRRNLFSSIPNPILSPPSSPSVQPTLSPSLSHLSSKTTYADPICNPAKAKNWLPDECRNCTEAG